MTPELEAAIEREERVEDALALLTALESVKTIYRAVGLRADEAQPFSWYVVGPQGEVAYCQEADGQAHAEMIAAALNDRVAMCRATFPLPTKDD